MVDSALKSKSAVWMSLVRNTRLPVQFAEEGIGALFSYEFHRAGQIDDLCIHT